MIDPLPCQDPRAQQAGFVYHVINQEGNRSATIFINLGLFLACAASKPSRRSTAALRSNPCSSSKVQGSMFGVSPLRIRRVVRTAVSRILQEHAPDGSSKRWRTAALRAMIGGRKRSPSGAWLLLRGSKVILALEAMHRMLSTVGLSFPGSRRILLSGSSHRDAGEFICLWHSHGTRSRLGYGGRKMNLFFRVSPRFHAGTVEG